MYGRSSVALRLLGLVPTAAHVQRPDQLHQPDDPEQRYLFDELVRLLSAGPSRAQARDRLAQQGFRFTGTFTQAGQEVDGFSEDVALVGGTLSKTALTIIYIPGLDRAMGATILQADQRTRQQAIKLLSFSLDSVAAPVVGSPIGKLDFLGVDVIDSQRVIRIMLRRDGQGGDVYSLMYVVAPSAA